MKTIALLAAFALAGCNTTATNTTISTIGTDLGSARTLAQTAINAYPIIKGMALVAAAAYPSLAPQITSAIATLDPDVVQAQAALNLASTTAPVLLAMASSINAKVGALTVAAAPVITVIPSK